MGRGRGQQPLLTITDIEDLKRKGLNQSEIAKQFGVTRQYISWILAQHGKTSPRREALREYWPWDVLQEHRTIRASYAAREHVAYMILGEEGLSENGPELLDYLYGEMRLGRVLEYDPNIPSRGREPGGWIFRDRQVADRDLAIRVNEYTNMNDDMERAWHLPNPLPTFTETSART